MGQIRDALETNSAVKKTPAQVIRMNVYNFFYLENTVESDPHSFFLKKLTCVSEEELNTG